MSDLQYVLLKKGLIGLLTQKKIEKKKLKDDNLWKISYWQMGGEELENIVHTGMKICFAVY